MEIAAVDWGICALVAISGMISLVRGFVKEAMSLVVWIAAYIVAMRFTATAADLLVNVIDLVSMRQLVAAAGLFVGTLLLGALLNFLLGKLVTSTGLSGTDRTLGLVFGVFRGLLLILALVIMLPKMLPVDEDPWWQASSLIPMFQSFELWGSQAVIEVKDFFTSWV